jgi:integrase
MKNKQNYSLYKRNGYFYYRTYDDKNRKRTTGHSTHERTKTAAHTYVQNLQKKGSLPTKGVPTFGTFTENWFLWDSCSYVMERRQSGKVGRTYVEGQRSYLTSHIIPEFKDTRLSAIDKEMILSWLHKLTEKESRMSKPLSKVTINHCLRILKLILAEAEDRGYISKNPARNVGRLKKEDKRWILPTLAEFQTVFDEKSIPTIWSGNETLYAFNLIAATTGMRLGEIQALQIDNIRSDHIKVIHSWERQHGIKGTKTNTPRFVMTFARSEKWIKSVMDKSATWAPEDMLFFGKDRATPVSPRVVSNALYSALSKIGITEAIRKERGITFHAWRHFFVTNMRKQLTDWKLNKLTGHTSHEMADRYTSLTPADCGDVRKILEELFG